MSKDTKDTSKKKTQAKKTTKPVKATVKKNSTEKVTKSSKKTTTKTTTTRPRNKPNKRELLDLDTKQTDFLSDDIGLDTNTNNVDVQSIAEEDPSIDSTPQETISDEMSDYITSYDTFMDDEPQSLRSSENYLSTPTEEIKPGATKIKKIQVKTKNILEKMINTAIRPFAPPIPIKKLLLNNEVVVDNVLLVYFTEGQLLLGVLMAIIGIYIVGLLPFKLLGSVILLLGIIFFFTASGSEEIYITSARLLVRRLNLIDRLFHIPRDEQYLVKQAVSFQIGRAPINRILVLFDIGLLFWITYTPPPTIIAIMVWITLLTSFYYALRIRKRAISFQMSGGGNITIGVNKGIPLRFVQNFTETLLSRTLEQI